MSLVKIVCLWIAVGLADVGTTAWLVDSLIPTIQGALYDSVGFVDDRNVMKRKYPDQYPGAHEPQTYSVSNSFLFGFCVAAICFPTIVSISFLNPHTTKWVLALPFVVAFAIGTVALSVDAIAYTTQQDVQNWIKVVAIVLFGMLGAGSAIVVFAVADRAWQIDLNDDCDVTRAKAREIARLELATEEEKQKLREKAKLDA